MKSIKINSQYSLALPDVRTYNHYSQINMESAQEQANRPVEQSKNSTEISYVL